MTAATVSELQTIVTAARAFSRNGSVRTRFPRVATNASDVAYCLRPTGSREQVRANLLFLLGQIEPLTTDKQVGRQADALAHKIVRALNV